MLSLGKIRRAQKTIDALPFVSLRADQVEFLDSASAFHARIQTLIARAQKRIYITALYWQKDEAGEALLRTLYHAKRANPALDIQIFVDWHRAQRGLIGAADQSSNADFYTRLAAEFSDVEIPIWGVPINGREVFGVLHLKGFVFDDTVLYSGASLNNVYLQHDTRYRYDRYQQITQPALAESFVRFLTEQIVGNEAVHRLNLGARPKTAEFRPQIRAFRKQLSHQHYAIQANASHDSLRAVPLIGLGRKNSLNHVIESLFYLPTRQLTLCTPYFNFPRTLQKRLNWLLKQGCHVEIIVGDKTANDFYTPPEEKFSLVSALPYLYEKNLRKFAKKYDEYLQNGQLCLRLWKDGNNSYHLKGVWVDDRYLLLTGNNLNPRAWNLDAENAILIADPAQALAQQAQTELQAIRQHTTLLTHYSQIDDQNAYPSDVKKVLKKFGRTRLDKIIKMLL